MQNVPTYIDMQAPKPDILPIPAQIQLPCFKRNQPHAYRPVAVYFSYVHSTHEDNQ